MPPRAEDIAEVAAGDLRPTAGPPLALPEQRCPRPRDQLARHRLPNVRDLPVGLEIQSDRQVDVLGERVGREATDVREDLPAKHRRRSREVGRPEDVGVEGMVEPRAVLAFRADEPGQS